jgi:hypothetical protein
MLQIRNARRFSFYTGDLTFVIPSAVAVLQQMSV